MSHLSDRSTAKRAQLFDELKTELQVHTKIEEEIFYPAVRALRSKDARELVIEANEEHAIAKSLIKQISELEPDDETYKAKCKVLMDVVLHHAKEEEKHMFPEARASFSTDELKELGAKLEARKEYLMSGGLGESDSAEMDDEDETEKDEADIEAGTRGVEVELEEERGDGVDDEERGDGADDEGTYERAMS